MKHLLLIVSIAVLLVILSLGLWPFHAPRNSVTWLEDQNGLHFGDHGTVLSSGSFDRTGSADPKACSIEAWLEPSRTDTSGTFFSLYVPKQPIRLALHQSLSDLELRSGKRHFYVNDVFHAGRPVFLTISSGSQGTQVYLNGTLRRTVRSLQFSPDHCAGRLIVGDAPWQQDPWQGDIRGLAIYANQLASSTVLQHYRTWILNDPVETGGAAWIVGLYPFNERSGSVAYNRVRHDVNLSISGTYTVQEKLLLEPFWSEFEWSWSYVRGVLKNVVGFVPLGFCFCAYLDLIRKIKRATLVTVLLGFAVSLTIEILQWVLPTRDSGTTDLITNTLGAWIGAMLYDAAKARWNRYTAPQENSSL